MNETEHSTRRSIVIGPPGCGKTTYVAEQARRAVKKYGPKGVLLCSYTNAAAEEIASRDTDVHHTCVGTMHHFARAVCGGPDLVYTPALQKEWHRRFPDWTIKRWAGNLDTELDAQGDGEGDRLLRASDLARARCEDPHTEFLTEWRRFLFEHDVTDFTGLLEDALAVPRAPLDVRVAFFDEAQDFSALELRLALHWAEHLEHVVFVGDPDQSLYAFKGASPEAMAPREGDYVQVLEQSFRVPERAVRVAKEILTPAGDYHPTETIGVVEPLEATLAECGKRYASGFEALREVLEEAEFDGDETMILAQANYMLAPILTKLRLEGWRFHNPLQPANGAVNPLARRDVGIVGAVRRFVEPWEEWTEQDLKLIFSTVAVKGNLEHGSGKLLKDISSGFHDVEPGEEFHDVEASFPAQARARAGARSSGDPAIRSILETIGGGREWLTCGDPHELLDRMKPAGGRVPLKEYVRNVIEREGVEALADPPRIIVGTIHSVKGGGADRVIVFPDLSKAAYDQMSKRGWDGRGALDRLFYVAVTRTKKYLYLAPPSHTAAGSVPHYELPSPYGGEE